MKEKFLKFQEKITKNFKPFIVICVAITGINKFFYYSFGVHPFLYLYNTLLNSFV